MNEFEKGELDLADRLFRQAQDMKNAHLDGKAPWDHDLWNRMVIQLQVAWPIIRSEVGL